MDGVAKAIEDLNVIDAILGGFHGSILFTMENSAIPRRLETSPNLDGLARKVDVSTGRGANRPRRRRSVVRRTVIDDARDDNRCAWRRKCPGRPNSR